MPVIDIIIVAAVMAATPTTESGFKMGLGIAMVVSMLPLFFWALTEAFKKEKKR
jgi:hypothetical protein